MRFALAASLLAGAAAQDPAQGWLAYATATTPPPGATRITSIDARWRVGANPRNSQSFYSPWFGMVRRGERGGRSAAAPRAAVAGTAATPRKAAPALACPRAPTLVQDTSDNLNLLQVR